MTAFFSKHKRSRFILIPALTLLLSLCLCVVSACSNGSGNGGNDTPPTAKTDNCAIANGNFEYYTDDDGLKLIVSPNSWSVSNGQDDLGNTASSSIRASGIVSTNEERWKSLTESANPFEIAEGANVRTAMRNAARQWSSMSVYDRLHFYEQLENAVEEYNQTNSNTLSVRDFEYYSDYEYEISAEDIPDCENPGTHNGNKDQESVLMIHNYRADGNGTAQRFTSSTTVTLNAGTSAKLSVWVKTQDLTYSDGTKVDGTRGANINITHSVSGQSLDEMKITNINTEDVQENNGWVQYTVYVRASAYAPSAFTVALGLGQGSSTDSWEYVQGYAFFDDVELEIISNEEYGNATQNETEEYTVPYCTMRSTANDKKFATDSERYENEFVYALDLYEHLNVFDITERTDVHIDLTSTMVNNTAYTTANYKNMNISTDGDVTRVASFNELSSYAAGADNEYLSTVLERDFTSEKYPFDKDGNIIFLMSAHGAAYTAKMDANDNLFTLARDQYMLVSFWVKTSDTTDYTGATVTLYDQTNTSALGAYNTATMATVDLDNEKDIFDGWVRCFFFIGNNSFSDKTFRLEFSYGPTTITGTTKSSFSEGYAAFTGFSYCEMTESDYTNYTGSTPQSATVSLTGEYSSNIAGDGFDAVSNLDTEKIEETIANPSSYKGVEGGNILIGGDGSTDLTTNENPNAGLVNKNYVGGYNATAQDFLRNNPNENNWLTNLLSAAGMNVTESLTTLNWWNEIFGTSTQPLLISNVVAQSYGYFSTNYNLSSSGYSALSVRVKVSAGAKAYIYLIDTSDLFKGYGSTAKLNTVNATYWYDDDGNVCLSDPQDNDFNAATDTAFYRLENGLFQNNLDNGDTNLYANLANYEKDANGNLLARTDSNGNLTVSYEYSDDYVDDGIAFYFHNGAYYAYYNADNGEYSTEVKDFGDVTVNGKNFTKEYARYISVNYLEENGWTDSELGANVTVNGKTNTDTYITVDGGTRENPSDAAGKWITVSFYLVTGSEYFPYRLEVFSGSRDGSVQSEAGSYVIFDVCNSVDLSTNYNNLLSEAIEDMTATEGYTDSRSGETVRLKKDSDNGRLVYAEGDKAGQIYDNAQYYCYTFYDDPAFQRYDQSLDENNDGNPYMTYVQSEREETLTYLYYETENIDNGTAYCMFLNYTPIYQTVSMDNDIDIDEEEETTNRWWEDSDFWLMLSSIILAVILILVLIIMLTVKLVRKFTKKNTKQNNRYNAKKMHYIRKMDLNTENENADGEENPYNE